MLERDGQVRLWWERNPVDLFFSYDPFHDAARDAARRVPFADTEIPVLAADHLVVCKAVFDRPKDWVDVDAMLAAGAPIDSAEVLRWVARITGPDDRAVRKDRPGAGRLSSRRPGPPDSVARVRSVHGTARAMPPW